MWSSLDKALARHRDQEKMIFAQNYSLPWEPTDIGKAQSHLRHIFKKPIDRIEINVPSLGQYWPTHPTYRYLDDHVVFVKCGEINNMLREFYNLAEMKKKGISVPAPLGFYEVSDEVWQEDKDFAPYIIKGAILIEEFLFSISLGHALVDDRINVAEMGTKVLEVLTWLYRFGVHGDMKHQHIRICLESKAAHALIFEANRNIQKSELRISRIALIDGEDYLSKDQEGGNNIANDFKMLEERTLKYFDNLNHLDADLLQGITTLPRAKWLERFKEFWGIINPGEIIANNS